MTFWEFKRKLVNRKEEQLRAMVNKKGEVKEEKEEILKIYSDFYQSLFETKIAKTEEEKEAENEIEQKFMDIIKVAETQSPLKIKKEDVEKTINGLKLKKARDRGGWNNGEVWGRGNAGISLHHC